MTPSQPTISRNLQAGFTLLEIMIASTIFALSIFALVGSATSSQRSVIESEKLFQAVQLGQSKMVELELKYQKIIDRDGVKDGSFTEDAGSFDKPYEGFRWTSKLSESSLKIGRNDLLSLMTDLGIEKDAAEEQLDSQALVLTNLNKMIKENYAELLVRIEWDHLGRKSSMPLMTHLIPASPKIQLTTTVDDGGGSSSSGGSTQ